MSHGLQLHALSAAVACVTVLALAACSGTAGQIAGTAEPDVTTSAGVSSSTSELQAATGAAGAATLDPSESTSDSAKPMEAPTTVSSLQAPAEAAELWTVQQAGKEYLKVVAPSNAATSELNLLGPATEKNLDALTSTASRAAAAQVAFRDALTAGAWPDAAASAVAQLIDQVDSDIDTWTAMAAATTPAMFESASEPLYQEHLSASVAVRKALALPAGRPTSQAGKVAHNLGATVTITKTQVLKSLPAKDSARVPDSGGVFVALDTLIVNDSKQSMDLTCGYPIGNKLIDSEGRQYDSVDDLYELPGNPECNANLQPGFKAKMRYAYMVPTGVHITNWAFFDASDLDASQRSTFVSLDFSTD